MLQFVVNEKQEPVIIPAPIDYGATFVSLMSAGKYRYPDPDVTEERFFVRGSGVRTTLFRILEVPEGPRLASDDVFASIARHGMRGATLLELLAVAASDPGLPGATPTVRDLAAFGAVRRLGEKAARRCVPVVQRYNGHRYVEPHPLHFAWRPGDQFLVASVDQAAP